MKTQVSFIFDDGFKKSCLQVAEIFEERELSATFAVLADPSGFLDKFPKGDFSLWNEFQSRGHHINPHGYDHTDLSIIPIDAAIAKVDRCLDHFGEHLDNFDPSSTTYPTTYNRTTPEVDAYLLEKVRAIRTCGPAGEPTDGLNSAENILNRSFTSTWHGPDYCDDHLLEHLKNAESSNSPLFLYMLHGLDNEGWGPIRKKALKRALDSILESDSLIYAPLDTLAL